MMKTDTDIDRIIALIYDRIPQIAGAKHERRCSFAEDDGVCVNVSCDLSPCDGAQNMIVLSVKT
jgi:hypothetical protein